MRRSVYFELHMKKLTHEGIQKYLDDNDRNITLLKYGGGSKETTSLFKCDECSHEWTTSVRGIKRCKGCGQCAKLNRKNGLTHESIQKYLDDNGRNITLLKYGGKSKESTTEFKCGECSHEWTTSVVGIKRSIEKGYGCPSCSNTLPLTHEDIQQHLDDNDRNITLLKYGGHSLSPSEFKCVVCSHEWTTSTNNIKKGNGCASCSGNAPLTYESIQKYLDDNDRNITLLKYGGGSKETTTEFKCGECSHEWTTSVLCMKGSIEKGYGCPSCSNTLPLTHEDIQQHLDDNDRNITLLKYGGGVAYTALFKCGECSHEWTALAGSVKRSTGCPACAQHQTESKQSAKFRKYLTDNNYEFRTEYRFPSIKHKALLPFDFCVQLQDNSILVVEIDGIQHFQPTYFGSVKGKTKEEVRVLREQNLTNTQHRDGIKTKGIADMKAEGKPIDLLRIRYDEDVEEIFEGYISGVV
jgi:DNA-directed RNA polymerase subunit RPC12/RpoP